MKASMKERFLAQKEPIEDYRVEAYLDGHWQTWKATTNWAEALLAFKEVTTIFPERFLRLVRVHAEYAPPPVKPSGE